MHGAGNDFVVIDAIDQPLQPSAAQVRLLADRRRGIGCDQLLLLQRSADPGAAFAYLIYNTDGSPARQCGNGARCVADWLARERGLQLPAVLHSPAGLVSAQRLDDGQIAIGLDAPGAAAAPLQLQFEGRRWECDPVTLGNPHLVLAVDDVDAAPVQQLGVALNADPRLPDGVNVEFVQRCPDGTLKARVYERGVGETLACGSGACAVAIVAVRRGWVTDREQVQVRMPGGLLRVSWPHESSEVLLAGPCCRVFEGSVHPEFLDQAQVGIDE